MKEHRKHPSTLGYPGESSSQVDRHDNTRTSLREREKRKTSVRKADWEEHGSGSKTVDDRDSKRFKGQRDRDRERTRRSRERDERSRTRETSRERDRRSEVKKSDREKSTRSRTVEKDRVARVEKVHEPTKDSTPIGGETDEAEMLKLMGFGNFDTTKGKQVPGNNVSAVHVIHKRKYRQYMNRKGGFNRPLDFVA
ncbi:U4/U6.U5 small nuclear ribonucleoprotein 27 kDa protein-like [Panonychus citri]|uniref:U4/U6.U5 small nuclear ribonucleoprotein 27 kDa protein-like n=1 Tax=Panonychus citri TaxID=50023 RepID=UPI002307E7D1|nr:U4/U6.U5 small nuclear ribonucleoprotein 27 kDa protein-like [Panonychus citri]